MPMRSSAPLSSGYPGEKRVDERSKDRDRHRRDQETAAIADYKRRRPGSGSGPVSGQRSPPRRNDYSGHYRVRSPPPYRSSSVSNVSTSTNGGPNNGYNNGSFANSETHNASTLDSKSTGIMTADYQNRSSSYHPEGSYQAPTSNSASGSSRPPAGPRYWDRDVDRDRERSNHRYEWSDRDRDRDRERDRYYNRGSNGSSGSRYDRDRPAAPSTSSSYSYDRPSRYRAEDDRYSYRSRDDPYHRRKRSPDRYYRGEPPRRASSGDYPSRKYSQSSSSSNGISKEGPGEREREKERDFRDRRIKEKETDQDHPGDVKHEDPKIASNGAIKHKDSHEQNSALQTTTNSVSQTLKQSNSDIIATKTTTSIPETSNHNDQVQDTSPSAKAVAKQQDDASKDEDVQMTEVPDKSVPTSIEEPGQEQTQIKEEAVISTAISSEPAVNSVSTSVEKPTPIDVSQASEDISMDTANETSAASAEAKFNSESFSESHSTNNQDLPVSNTTNNNTPVEPQNSKGDQDAVLPCIYPMTKLEAQLGELKEALVEDKDAIATLTYLHKEAKDKPTLRAYWFYEANIQQFEKESQKLLEALSQRVEELHKSESLARSKYFKLRSEWLKKCEELDAEHDRFKAPEMGTPDPSIVITTSAPQTPSVAVLETNNATRPNSGSRRRGGGFQRDAVTSEAEFLHILAQLQKEDDNDPAVRAMLTSAKVPEMINDEDVRKHVMFYNTNELIADKSIPYKRLFTDGIDTFTQEESDAFTAAFIAHPKQFGKIARIMGGMRTYHECVLHYYQTKKTINYKNLVAQKNRRTSTRKGNSASRKKASSSSSNKTKQPTTGPNTPTPSEPENNAQDDPLDTLVNAAVVLPRQDDSSEVVASVTRVADVEGSAKKRAKVTKTRKKSVGSADEIVPSEPPQPIPEQQAVQQSTTQQATTQQATIPQATVPQATVPQVTVPQPAEPVKEIADVTPQPSKTPEFNKGPTVGSIVAASTAASAPVPVLTKDKVSSYWSLHEIGMFEKLLASFGTRWDEMSRYMPNKSSVMLKNYYNKHAADKGYDKIVAAYQANPEAAPEPPTPQLTSTPKHPPGISTIRTSIYQQTPPPQHQQPPKLLANVQADSANITVNRGPAVGFFAPRGKPALTTSAGVAVPNVNVNAGNAKPELGMAATASTAENKLPSLPVEVAAPVAIADNTTVPVTVTAPTNNVKTEYEQPPRPVINPTRSLLSSILNASPPEIKDYSAKTATLPPLGVWNPPQPLSDVPRGPGSGMAYASNSNGNSNSVNNVVPLQKESTAVHINGSLPEVVGGSATSSTVDSAQQLKPAPYGMNGIYGFRSTTDHLGFVYNGEQPSMRESNERGGTRPVSKPHKG